MEKQNPTVGKYVTDLNEGREVDRYSEHIPENDEKTHRLLQLLHHPWRLIKEGGKLGVNGVKRFATVLFLFSLTNIVLFFYALSRLFSTDFEFGKVLLVFLVLVIGIVMTVYAAYRTYQYVIIDAMQVVYGGLSSYFQKLSEMIVDKVETTFRGKVNLTETNLAKALDYGKMINSRYQKTPKLLRKGMLLILNRIPIAGMLTSLSGKISKGNKLEASKMLYTKMDVFISDTIFGNNNTKWIWWLLPLNILLVVMVVKWRIG